MSNIPVIDTPTFDGQQIFGDLQSFRAQVLQPLVGANPSALAIDQFLGRTPGTTQYGASGRIFGVSGAFIAGSPSAVTALVTEFLLFAGLCCTFGIPTGLAFPGDFYPWPACYFVLA